MALRDRFPFNKIFKLLDKVISVASILKTLLDVFKKKEPKDAD